MQHGLINGGEADFKRVDGRTKTTMMSHSYKFTTQVFIIELTKVINGKIDRTKCRAPQHGKLIFSMTLFGEKGGNLKTKTQFNILPRTFHYFICLKGEIYS